MKQAVEDALGWSQHLPGLQASQPWLLQLGGTQSYSGAELSAVYPLPAIIWGCFA